MFSGFVPLTPEFASVQYRPEPAIYQRANVEDRPWPVREAGTGGIADAAFVRDAYGYQLFQVLQQPNLCVETPFAKLMEQVKAGFGRTLSRLPAVFGVSRQTLYNWLEGETPKPVHHERIRHLADAAKLFQHLGVKPTTLMLERNLAKGKSFLELMAEGADGKETAKQLIRVVQRGGESRAKLDALLGGRKTVMSPADFGAQALDETS